jgi:protein O-mannosyl-transferase
MGQAKKTKERHSSLSSAKAPPCPASPPRASASVWGLPRLVAAVLLMLLVFAAFSACLGNDFVTWDDDRNFLDNPYYRGLGWAQIRWDWTSFRIGVYQPIAWMILGAEYLVWGMKPWGYHLISLILYAIDTVVLFVLTVALLERCRPGLAFGGRWSVAVGAGLSVAFFAVNPLRTEVVAWASCQPYLPCALFSMLAVLVYLRAFRYGPAPHWGWLGGSFVLVTAALLSKAVAVSVPLVLLILDVYPLGRLGGGPGGWFGPSARKVWLEKVPFAAMSVVFMVVAIVGRVEARHLASVQRWGISARIAHACYGIWFYPIKTFIPVNLTAYYELPERLVWFEFPFLLCILATVGVSVALFLVRRRWPALLAVWLTYLAILAPNVGLMRIGDQIAADRYSYIAMFGVVALVAAGLCRLCQSAQCVRPIAVGLMASSLGLIVGLVFLTRDQCRTWRTTEALWAHVLGHGGSRSPVAHSLLALGLFQQGRLDEAAAHLTEALKSNVGPVDTRYNLLGVIRLNQGRLEEAAAQFGEAIRLNPNNPKPRSNLGLTLFRQGRLEEAAAQYAEALKYSVGPGDARDNLLGAIRLKQGRLEEAAAQFGVALQLNPSDPETHCNLGLTRLRQGRLEEARTAYVEALRLNPDIVSAHHNLAEILIQQGRLDDGRAHLAEVVRLNPNDANAHYTLAIALLQLGRFEEAKEQYSRAFWLVPNPIVLHKNLGDILRQFGRIDEALAQYSEIVRLDPNNVDAENCRAMLWATYPESKYRDGRRAVASATRACELTGWKNAGVLDTLAAASAEAGDFASAVKWQTRAIELLPGPKRDDNLRSRLDLYEHQQPYREPTERR